MEDEAAIETCPGKKWFVKSRQRDWLITGKELI